MTKSPPHAQAVFLIPYFHSLFLYFTVYTSVNIVFGPLLKKTADLFNYLKFIAFKTCSFIKTKFSVTSLKGKLYLGKCTTWNGTEWNEVIDAQSRVDNVF